jgi:ferredoxin
VDRAPAGRKSGGRGASLPATTRNGQARRRALSAIGSGSRTAESVVTYRSDGRVLVIAPNEQAGRAAISGLSDQLRCVLLVTASAAAQPAGEAGGGGRSTATPVAMGQVRTLSGHLGEFHATAATPDAELNLAALLSPATDSFDIVLDLTSPAIIQREIPPPGYFAPGADPQLLRQALAEIPEMIGEFEKPKFFHYNPDICAHGARGMKGCTRCLEVCPTWAIRSIGDKIEVDPHLCQGAGSCATACPTGAITYGYPPVADLLSDVRGILKNYRDAGGENATVLFHDAETGKQLLAASGAELPETIIPLEVEEIGSVGMDTWLSTLAYGASRVALLATATVAPSIVQTIRTQLVYVAAILEGMAYSPDRLQLVEVDNHVDLLARLAGWQPEVAIVPAGFVALNEKRNMLRLAVDHLHAQSSKARRVIPLPEGAPFGEIRVNRKTCTLCMACVAVCPTSALTDGADLPQLRFYEWNCVQCGLCEKACPETAITRTARFVGDPDLRQQTRVLNEQQPFHCVECGKPFGTQALMDRMTEKLKGHWMYGSPDAMRRLQMCEDCRVKSMFRATGDLIDVHRRQ